eukprot:4242604-Pleurochrysis_carterae.AAC.1
MARESRLEARGLAPRTQRLSRVACSTSCLRALPSCLWVPRSPSESSSTMSVNSTPDQLPVPPPL